MDFDGLISVLTRIHAGELRCLARDTPEPSAFAHEIINAKPYAFMDDAPLEERRTQAVQTRTASDQAGSEMRALDADAIARVRDEERPDPRDADELHDALLTAGFLLEGEITIAATPLTETRRAARATIGGIVIAAERLPELLAIHSDVVLEPPIAAPPSRMARVWTREEAIVELLRGRLSIVGPTTAAQLAASLCIADDEADTALLALESEGAVLRGHFSPSAGRRDLEWCDRRLLARIHRYTLNRLRAEIAPVSPADFMRFLLVWQHVAPESRLLGLDGLREAIAQLDGVEAPARAWERDVLASRVERYEPAMLDMLCLTGAVAWARLSSGPTQVVGATPIALFLREHADAWLSMTSGADPNSSGADPSGPHSVVLDHLRTHGASFANELAAACDLSDEQLRAAIADLVAAGAISSDGFAGVRAIVGASPN
jgi:ATP-dependent Lhr-like helicase